LEGGELKGLAKIVKQFVLDYHFTTLQISLFTEGGLLGAEERSSSANEMY